MTNTIKSNKQPNSWRVRKIEDIAEVVGGGTPSTKNPDNFGGEIPWITPKDLSEHKDRYIGKGERNLTKQGLHNSSAKMLPSNTVLLSSRAPVGYTAISGNELCTNQGFRSMIPKKNVNSEYLYYLVKANTHVFESNASGSTFKELSGGLLKKLSFLIAPEPEQKEIASVLSSLDDKIELNRQMNQTLEEIGKALFRQWFVDFDFPFDFAQGKPNLEGNPYKSSGGEMVNSELGEIPRGWSVKRIKDFGDIVLGSTPSKKNRDYFGGDIPFIKIPDMHNRIYVFETEDTLTEKGLNAQNSRTLPQNSICVSCIATVGEICLTTQTCQTNQQINSVIPNKDIYMVYLFYRLKLMKKQLIKYASGGSATLNLNKTNFSKIKIIVPPEDLLEKYKNFVNPLFSSIRSNSQENIFLSKARDFLLPKLISGKLRVKKYE